MKNEKPTLGLINYEGDVLKLKKSNDEFVIYDQWDHIVEILSLEKFKSWLNGEFGLIDSHSKTWFFTEHHTDARTPLEVIYKYINQR